MGAGEAPLKEKEVWRAVHHKQIRSGDIYQSGTRRSEKQKKGTPFYGQLGISDCARRTISKSRPIKTRKHQILKERALPYRFASALFRQGNRKLQAGREK